MNTMHTSLKMVIIMNDRSKKIIKKSLMLFAYILVIVAIILGVTYKNSSLKKIGYNKNEIAIINKLSEDEIKIIKNYRYDKGLVDIVTDEEYNKENLDLYLHYLTKYNCTKGIIRFVNNYKDTYDESKALINILGGKYFIEEYLERYMKYYNSNLDLDSDEVITRVNSNLDYTFYKDSKPADTSKGMYTLVNKYYYLKSNYKPSDLVKVSKDYTRNNTTVVKVAYDAFVEMVKAAKEENLVIKATTCYRDYNFQSTLYNKYVKADGVAKADTYSARPGYSEHQLGYSCDVTNGNFVAFEEFHKTKEYEWLKENSYKYGFILRYPEDKEYITGYMFEPWHYRYVGLDIAEYIYKNSITYEEYYAYFKR